MNRTLRIGTLAAAAVAWSVSGSTARAQGKPVMIAVNVANESPKKAAAKTDAKPAEGEMIQMKKLEISVTNVSPQDFPALTVKYYLFAKGAGDKEPSVAKSGDEPIKLAPMAKAKVVSPVVTFSYTGQHVQKSGKSNIPIPAKGDKYAGYAVQVMNGDVVLGEVCDPADLKTALQAVAKKEGAKK